MRSSPVARSRRAALWLATGLLCLGACRTPDAPAVPAFRQGVATADKQTATTFAEINAMLRVQQLDRAARAESLDEEMFGEALPADAVATWARAFAALEQYAGNLERLLAPEHRSGVEDELRELGARFSALDDGALPGGVAAAFVRLGGLLVRIRSEQDALKAMRAADAAVQDVFRTMADAIGATPEDGVRLTVWSSWTTRLGEPQIAFLRAESAEQKRAIAARYVDMLREREAHDLALAALRSSLLTLANAHARMAAGSPASASALIEIVQAEYEAFERERANGNP